MAISNTNLFVAGRSLVKTNSTNLGITDSSDSIQITLHHETLELMTNEGGPRMPYKIINLGMTATITVPFAVYNVSQLDGLRKLPGSTSADGNQLGTLGADIQRFPITILPDLPNVQGYTFGNCYFEGDENIGPWGYETLKRAVTFKAIFDPSILCDSTNSLFVYISNQLGCV